MLNLLIWIVFDFHFLTIELPVYCIVWIYIIKSCFIFPKSFYFLPEIKLNSMLYFYNHSSTFQMDLLMFIFRSYFPFFPCKTMIYFLIAERSIFFLFLTEGNFVFLYFFLKDENKYLNLKGTSFLHRRGLLEKKHFLLFLTREMAPHIEAFGPSRKK